jgi:hypothetical protein
MKNGRCRLHGGKSTGPRTPEGLARSKAARWVHGNRSAAVREQARQRGQASRLLAEMRAIQALISAEPGGDVDPDEVLDRLTALEAAWAAQETPQG